jgi:hypothetical protein
MRFKSTKASREDVLRHSSPSRRNAKLPAVPVQAEERRVVHDVLHGLGHDPANVRVRHDAAAAASHGAQAFTSGDDVVLGGSAPALDGPEGMRLLAHELVHVAQFHEARRQGQVPSGRSRATDPAERQAVRMADEIVTHGRVSEHPLVPATATVHAQELSPAQAAATATGAGAAAASPAAIPPSAAATAAGAGAANAAAAAVATTPPTVTASSTEVVPTGTPGTNTTTLTITGTPATAYSIGVTATESRGHAHTSTTRPLGVITPSATVTTGTNGTVTATYTSPIVAGTEHITVKKAGQADAPETTLDIRVQVANLTPLGAGAGYSLIGQTATHPDNHYGTAGAIAAYQAVGTSWAAIPGTITQLVQPIQAARALPNAPTPPAGGTALTNAQLSTLLVGPTQAALEALSNAQLAQVLAAVQNWPTLGYNDMSLEWGGVFDINATWAPPHSTHRVGKNLDFRLSNMGSLHQLVVESLMTGQGLNVLHENAAHWHLTAP